MDSELSVDRVSKSFEGIRALNQCSFDVRPGSITGLIGPNGAGKSTLFNVITGFHPPDTGEIWFRGERIQPGLKPHEVFQRGLYRSFQTTRQLASITVLENLLLAPSNQTGEQPWNPWFRMDRVQSEEEQSIEKAQQVLEFIGMKDKAHHYAGNLSGGQRKLLELGRLMMVDPELVLLDEPGAGVNPALQEKVNDRIRTLNREQEITFLIVEHDMNVIQDLCDPVIVLVNGARMTEGPPSKIQNDPEVIEAYLGAPAET